MKQRTEIFFKMNNKNVNDDFIKIKMIFNLLF